MKEDTQNKETHQQAEKRGVEKSSMPKEMIVRNTKVESDSIQIRGHGTGYCKRPKTVRDIRLKL